MIFNYGDIGMKLYIILEGDVFILVPKDKDKKDKELDLIHRNQKKSVSPIVMVQK